MGSLFAFLSCLRNMTKNSPQQFQQETFVEVNLKNKKSEHAHDPYCGMSAQQKYFTLKKTISLI